MKKTSIRSIFGQINENDWLEYLVKIKETNKENKPINFEATLVWRSNIRFSAPAVIRGSFKTVKEAMRILDDSIHEIGGKTVDMNKKKLEYLSNEFKYPESRIDHLSNGPLLKEKII